MFKKIFKFFLVFILLFALASCEEGPDADSGSGTGTGDGDGDNGGSASTYVYTTPVTDELKLTADYAGKDFIEDGIGEVTVVQYVDGDTTIFKSVNGGSNFTVRYQGINTPESTYKVEPWGFAASKYTKKMLKAASKIVLVADDLDNRLDSTGKRYLSWVWLIDENGDSRLLNLELVELAYAQAKANATTLADSFTKAVYNVTLNKCRIYGETDPDYDYSTEAKSMSLKEIKETYGTQEQLTKEEYKGTKVTVSGVVARMNGITSCYIQQYDEETDDYYGVYVYGGFTSHGEFAVGNSVVITGKIGYYYGNLQITDVSNIKLRAWADSENPEATVNKLAIEDLSVISYTNTTLFGRLVTVSGLTVTGGSDADATNAFTLYCKYTGTDGNTHKLDVRVDQNIVLKDDEGNRISTYEYFNGKTFASLTAIVSYYDYDYSDETSAYNGYVQLLLTQTTDYTFVTE